MDQGTWHPSCGKCRITEESGGISMRLAHANGFTEYGRGLDGLIHLTIMTGNKCNLQCRSCGPWASSSWKKEYEHVPMTVTGTDRYHITIEADLENERHRHYAGDDFTNVRSVTLLGGEPLYNPECFGLLEKIYQATNGDCEIGITTNSTIPIDFKKFPFLEKFRSIILALSIDATGKAAEFIRTGCDWDRVVSVIDSYQNKNITLAYHLTHSVLNMFTAADTRRWLEARGIPSTSLTTFVIEPEYLSFKILTDQEKSRYAELAKNTGSQYIHDRMTLDSYDPEQREKFFAYMEHTRRFHGMDWQEYLPELYDFMNKS